MITLRPAAAGDMIDVGRIYVMGHWSAYRGYVPRAHLLAMDAAIEGHLFAAELAHAGCIFIVAVNGTGRVVGFAFGGMTLPQQAGLSELFVERRYRGKRVAERLLCAFAQRVHGLGAVFIRGPVAKCNARSRAFCLKTGAQEVDLGEHFPVFDHVAGKGPIDLESVYEDWHDVAGLAACQLPVAADDT